MLASLRNIVSNKGYNDEDVKHLKRLSSGSLLQHLKYLSSRLEEDDERMSMMSARSSKSTTSSHAPSSSINLSDVDMALMLQSANILGRARLNQHYLYQGAMMAEWTYLNAGGVGAGSINSTNTHAHKDFAGGNTALERVFKLLQAVTGLDLIDLNAELARSHIEIFRRQGLMSEPYHIRRAVILMRDVYARKKALDKKKPAAISTSSGWFIGGGGAGAGTVNRDVMHALMYWEIFGTKSPDRASANNSVVSPAHSGPSGQHSQSGSSRPSAYNKPPKRLRYSTKEKYRIVLMNSIAGMFATSLVHAGELEEALPVAQDMLEEARTDVTLVETAISDARKEVEVEIQALKASAAHIESGGSVGGISLSYSDNASVASGASGSSAPSVTRAEQYAKEQNEKHKKRRKGEKEDKELVTDHLVPVRAEVLLRKKRLVAHRLLLNASIQMGLTSYEQARDLLTILQPKKCEALDEALPPLSEYTDSKPSSAGLRPPSRGGSGSTPSKPQSSKSKTDTSEDAEDKKDHPLPEGLSDFDIMFIFGRCSELLVEQKLGLESPMDGYLAAFATSEKTRMAEELKKMEADIVEKKKWESARTLRMNRAILSATGGESPTKNDSEGGKATNDDKNPKNEPEVVLDMKDVIAARLKIKQENFRRRKELRKMRRLGIKAVQAEDPNAKIREQKLKRMRADCKKWLAHFHIWSSVADKLMHIGLPSLAADLYRQGILRDNVGYARSKLWFAWAKACHQCGRVYDTKLAVNQVQHFEPENLQIKIIRRHMDIIGKGKSSRHGSNRETRTTFEQLIRTGSSIRDILKNIITPSSIYMAELFAAARMTSFIRRIAEKRKKAKEAAELERLQNIWKHKPAVTPVIIWEDPEPICYPSFLSRGVQLNAFAPVPPDSDDEFESDSESDDGGSDVDDANENENDEDIDEDDLDEEQKAKLKKKRRKARKRAEIDAAADDVGSLATLESSESLALLDTKHKVREIEGKWVYEPDDRAAPLPAGIHEIRVTFYPSNLEKYTSAVAAVNILVNINAAPVDVVWNDPDVQYIGTLLTAEKQLNALIKVGDALLTIEDVYEKKMGTVEYRPKLGTHLPVGTHPLTVVYTPHDTHNYGGATATVHFTIKPFLPIVKWDVPPKVTYPQRLRLGKELSAYCDEHDGTYVYSPDEHTNPLDVGTHELRCEFWPYDDVRYGVVSINTFVTIEKRKPQIEWMDPPHIYVGDAVTYEKHMNAKIVSEKRSDIPPLTGCFRYNMDEYMKLPCGHHDIKCLFFPDNMQNYDISTKELSITVRCTPKIKWTNIPIMRFGNSVEKKHLRAKVSECSGTFEYDPVVGYVPITTGEQDFKVKFTPNDLSLYDIVDLTIKVDVVPKLKPNLSWDSQPVPYGTPITFENALNATSDQTGRWEYEGSGIFVKRDEDGNWIGSEEDNKPILFPCGSYIVQATFYPLDTQNYEQVSLVGSVVVQKMQIRLSYGPLSDITYGDATTAEHFLSRLEPDTVIAAAISVGGEGADRNNSTFGSFIYSHKPGMILKAGTHEFEVKYVPNDVDNYTEATIMVPLKVSRHTPVVNWKKPSSIQYSDLITEKQLNAWVSDNVRDLPEDQQKIPGSITYTPELGHRFATVGRHPISCTFVPEDGFNYSTVHINFEISVRRFPVKVFWEKPEEIFEGQKLTDEQLNATHNFPDLSPNEGSLVYDPKKNTKLEQGEHHLLCKYVPHPKVKDNFDLRQGYCEVTIFIAPTRSGMKSRGR